jgi:uncharacterized membrane protein YqjE
MSETGDSGGGLLASIRKLLHSVLTVMQNRVELLAVEVQEEEHRLIQSLILAGAALFLGMVGFALLLGVVIFLLPENWRLGAAAALGVLCLLAAVVIAVQLKKRLQQNPFENSIEQLRKDWECLKPPR